MLGCFYVRIFYGCKVVVIVIDFVYFYLIFCVVYLLIFFVGEIKFFLGIYILLDFFCVFWLDLYFIDMFK